MKRILYLFLTILLLSSSFLGCKKEWDPFEPPVKPANKEFDLNDDQIPDFELSYRTSWLDGVYTGEMFSGYLTPKNNNKFIKHQNTGFFIVELNDTIFKQVELPLLWTISPTDCPILVKIASSSISGWEREWSSNKKGFNDYYLSFSLSANDKDYLGWMKVNINPKNGHVEILDKKLSDQSFIIIGK